LFGHCEQFKYQILHADKMFLQNKTLNLHLWAYKEIVARQSTQTTANQEAKSSKKNVLTMLTKHYGYG